MRHLIFAVLAVAFVVALVLHRAEFASLARAWTEARPLAVLAAALCECGALIALASLYRAALRAAGVAARFGATLSSLLGSLFASLVVPSAGLAGMALFVSEFGRRGHPAARTSLGFLVAAACDLIVLSGVTLATATAVRSRHTPWLFLAAGILGACALGLVAAVTAARWAPERLTRVLAASARMRDRIFAKWGAAPTPEGAPARATASARAAAFALTERPERIPGLVLWALAYHAAAASCLGMLMLAFGAEPSPDRVLTGYTLATAAWILSPVPQGIGAVEGVLALALTGLGVPVAASAWIAVLFRGLTFWLPLGLGVLALQRLRLLRRP